MEWAASQVPLYRHGVRASCGAVSPTCDINLVLITQIGLVAKVEHAPAVTDAQIRATHSFSC